MMILKLLSTFATEAKKISSWMTCMSYIIDNSFKVVIIRKSFLVIQYKKNCHIPNSEYLMGFILEELHLIMSGLIIAQCHDALLFTTWVVRLHWG